MACGAAQASLAAEACAKEKSGREKVKEPLSTEKDPFFGKFFP
jgi:hypothetical protein